MAAERVPQCPTEVSGKLVQVQPIGRGWKGNHGSRFQLERATIVMGPPDVAARAELRGAERKIDKTISETIYSGLDTHKEKWLVCAYGQGQDIEQVYRLNDSVMRCSIKTSWNQAPNRNDVSVSCQ